jgi:hypothetical protein
MKFLRETRVLASAPQTDCSSGNKACWGTVVKSAEGCRARTREIERTKKRRQILPIDIAIHCSRRFEKGSPMMSTACPPKSASSEPTTASKLSRILKIEPLAIHAPQELIVRIDTHSLDIIITALFDKCSKASPSDAAF